MWTTWFSTRFFVTRWYYIRSPHGPRRHRSGQSWPDNVIRSTGGLHEVIAKVNHEKTMFLVIHVNYRHCLQGLSLPDDVISSPRGLRHRPRGQSWPDDVICIPYWLSDCLRDLPRPDDILFVYDVNYVVVTKIHPDQIMLLAVIPVVFHNWQCSA